METDNPFEKVLDRLREKGWIKGKYREGDAACLLGAAMVVHAQRTFSRGLNCDSSLIEETIRSQYPDRLEWAETPIPSFNDHPDTTFADVERVLEKAAVKWEEERVMRDG